MKEGKTSQNLRGGVDGSNESGILREGKRRRNKKATTMREDEQGQG